MKRTFSTQFGPAVECEIILKGFAGGTYTCKSKVIESVIMDGTTSNIEFFIVSDGMIGANVLIGRDLLCRRGKQTIIEGYQCWVQNINAIESQDISTRVETEQLKTVLNGYKKSFAKN